MTWSLTLMSYLARRFVISVFIVFGAFAALALSIDLADLFSRHARRRVEDKFAAVFDNDDVRTYEVAQQVLKGEHSWMETGMVGGGEKTA